MSTVSAKSRSPAGGEDGRDAAGAQTTRVPGPSMREEASTKRGHLDVAGTPRCAQVLCERFAVEGSAASATALDKVPLPFRGHTITEREVPGCQTHLGCVCAHCAGSTYTQTAVFGEASTREEPRQREPPGVASRRRPRPCHPRRSPMMMMIKGLPFESG
ncbi:hypothetical protein MRX96_056400 [Rhipicephalus microplus]